MRVPFLPWQPLFSVRITMHQAHFWMKFTWNFPQHAGHFPQYRTNYGDVLRCGKHPERIHFRYFGFVSESSCRWLHHRSRKSVIRFFSFCISIIFFGSASMVSERCYHLLSKELFDLTMPPCRIAWGTIIQKTRLFPAGSCAGPVRSQENPIPNHPGPAQTHVRKILKGYCFARFI